MGAKLGYKGMGVAWKFLPTRSSHKRPLENACQHTILFCIQVRLKCDALSVLQRQQSNSGQWVSRFILPLWVLNRSEKALNVFILTFWNLQKSWNLFTWNQTAHWIYLHRHINLRLETFLFFFSLHRCQDSTSNWAQRSSHWLNRFTIQTTRKWWVLCHLLSSPLYTCADGYSMMLSNP